MCLLFVFGVAQKKKVCITVDDLPAVTNGINDYAFRLEITEKLIRTFKNYQAPAIGYVNERKVHHNGKAVPEEVRLLELWLEGGLELGNHTFSHPSYHATSFGEYTQDIIKGERITKPLCEKYNQEYKYFRHPYLRIGLRASHADSLSAFLNQNGYIEAPVTIDNADYLFAAAYTKAFKSNDTELRKKIATDYVDYMEVKLLFYERMSEDLYGRKIAQTLLIHANFLNANHVDELMDMYQKHGYSFVSQSAVLQDAAYRSEVTRFGDWGISWLDRWAMTHGKKGEFFKGDPTVPDYILKLTSD